MKDDAIWDASRRRYGRPVWHIHNTRSINTEVSIAKLQKVTQLLASLEKDLKESTLTSQRMFGKGGYCVLF